MTERIRLRRILYYHVTVLFVGATATRERRRYTTHKRFEFHEAYGYGPRADFTWDIEAWGAIKFWIEHTHAGEGAHILNIDRRVRSLVGGANYQYTIYKSAHDRSTAEPEPLPERMPCLE